MPEKRTEKLIDQYLLPDISAGEFCGTALVDWFNNRRLLKPIGDVSPAEFEQAYYDQLVVQAVAA